MDFKDYKFRSHAVGKIISIPKPLTANQKKTLKDYEERENGIGRPLTAKQKETLIDLKYKKIQSSKYKLTDGQKDLLAKLVWAEKYGRKIDINSDKLRKGVQVEKEARDLISRHCMKFLTASNERRTNDWVSGITDFEITDGVIPDIKSAYSYESFTKILQNKPNEIYLRQGDSYMDLFGGHTFILCHVLVDTPEQIVNNEIRKYDYGNNILDAGGNVLEEKIGELKQVISNHIFTRKGLEAFCDKSANVFIEWFDDFLEIPAKDRIHMIEHSFDSVRIEQRNECISLARDYMDGVTTINNFKPELI